MSAIRMEGIVRGEGGGVEGDVLGAGFRARLSAHPRARPERLLPVGETPRSERVLRGGRVGVAEVAVVGEFGEDVDEGDGGGVEDVRGRPSPRSGVAVL